ncbi:MAG: BrnT family toxin [Phycisphaerales bacterium]|nr:BrnT family toxin [Phycisphaerales bacterium]
MHNMDFIWDHAKNASNLRKHGISFVEAATVFKDPLAKVIDDPDHSKSEPRSIIIGLSEVRRLLIVVHVERGDRIRIISARHATRRERNDYEENAW